MYMFVYMYIIDACIQLHVAHSSRLNTSVVNHLLKVKGDWLCLLIVQSVSPAEAISWTCVRVGYWEVYIRCRQQAELWVTRLIAQELQEPWTPNTAPIGESKYKHSTYRYCVYMPAVLKKVSRTCFGFIRWNILWGKEQYSCIHYILYTCTCTSGQKLNFYFRGLLFTSHWLNLQHWTGFFIAVYGNFQGLFFDFRGLFLHFGGKLVWSPRIISPLLYLQILEFDCQVVLILW